MNIFSDQGLRLDGRRSNELRVIKCKLGVSSDAEGSAYMEHGHSKVLVTIYGPRDITSRKAKAPSDRVVLNCQFKIAPFAGNIRNKTSYGDRRSQEMSIVLRQAFEAAIFTDLYPGSQIDMDFLVLYSDGGICSTCINAGTLALVDAGIPIKDYLCACSVGFLNGSPVMDITHAEGILGGTELNLGILYNFNVIVCDELTARIHNDHMKKLREMALQGCKDIYDILNLILREQIALNQNS